MISFATDTEFLIVSVSSAKQFKEVELLMLARSIPYTIHHEAWQKSFYIHKQWESRAIAEIRSYLQENENWPPRQEASTESLEFRFSTLHVLIVVSLAFFHWYVTRTGFSPEWMAQGRFVARDVLAGEWWRVITALTLHVDDAHLLSNMAGLVVFAGSVGIYIGPGISWLAVLSAGALGNGLNAVFSQTAQPGVGASTAVFAAVGLIGIFGIKSSYRQGRVKTRFFVPLMAGFGIFAMLGTNPQTDVSAHLFGFFSGILVGVMLLPLVFSKPIRSRLIQTLCMIGFIMAIYGSWAIAAGLLESPA